MKAKLILKLEEYVLANTLVNDQVAQPIHSQTETTEYNSNPQ